MPPAIIAGGIGAAASIGGSLLSSSSNNKAIRQSTDAQLQASREALQYQKEAVADNRATLDPYVQSGYKANSQLDALLGLNENQPQQQIPPSNQQQIRPSSQWQLPPIHPHQGPGGYTGSQNILRQGEDIFNSAGQFGGNFNPALGAGFGFQNSAQNNALNPASQVTQPDAESAFDTFRNSSGYQFRLGEGLNAVNSGYAGAGALQSGAAMKDINEYGQNFASNEFGKYTGLLQNQQGVGLSAGNALAGVTTNFANNASNISQNNADSASNAAVARANNRNGLYSGIGSGIGTILGGL